MAEKSLTMVIRARDEASQKMRDMAANVRQTAMRAIGPFIAVGALLGTAAKAAASSVEMASAAQARAAAQAKGDITGMLEAQVKVNEAVGQFGASIPIVGSAVKRLLDYWNNTEGIQKQIAAIKEMEAAIKRYHEEARRLMRETAILEAKNREATAGELAEIELQFLRQNEAEKQKVREEDLMKARQALAAAGAEYAKSKQMYVENLEGGGIDVEYYRQQSERLGAVYEGMKKDYIALSDAKQKLDDETAKNLVAKQAEAEKTTVDETIKNEKTKSDAIKKSENEKAAAQRRALADALRIAEEERRAAEATANDRRRLERMIYDTTASARDKELMDLDDYLTDMQRKYETNQEMLELISNAGAARRDEIDTRYAKDAAAKERKVSRDVQATTSRFLSYAGEREKPSWVRDVTDVSAKGSSQIVAKLDALPTAIGKAIAGQFQVMN
jgi:hypothetical protein